MNGHKENEKINEFFDENIQYVTRIDGEVDKSKEFLEENPSTSTRRLKIL